MFVRLEGNLVTGFSRRVRVRSGSRRPTLEQHWLPLEFVSEFCDFDGRHVVLVGDLIRGYNAYGPIAADKLVKVQDKFEHSLVCYIAAEEEKDGKKKTSQDQDSDKKVDKALKATKDNRKKELWDRVRLELPKQYRDLPHHKIKKFCFLWKYVPDHMRKALNMFVTDVAAGMRVSKTMYGKELDQEWVGNWLTTAEKVPVWYNCVMLKNGDTVSLFQPVRHNAV